VLQASPCTAGERSGRSPKNQSMQLIHELNRRAPGPYSGVYGARRLLCAHFRQPPSGESRTRQHYTA